MERWQNKVAVVTGASSGMGAATAKDLVKAGFVVVALARRENRLQENKAALPVQMRPRYHPIKCDVTNEEEVKQTFAWIEKNLGGTDVLINCAGIARHGKPLADPEMTPAVREVLETNVMGMVYCIREAFNSMKKRNFDGHIVMINSIGGHHIPYIPGMFFNIYPATKHAVTAMAETYRQEFMTAGTKIKVTSISPGGTESEHTPQAQQELLKQAGHPFLKAEDISNAILYILSTPPHVQIHEMIIKPVGEQI